MHAGRTLAFACHHFDKLSAGSEAARLRREGSGVGGTVLGQHFGPSGCFGHTELSWLAIIDGGKKITPDSTLSGVDGFSCYDYVT